ncbi:MAG: electron transfer flavoprotein subunit beta/FixA family protein [Thermotogae bacterium]|nr:electron transfer flavoprotein subunit beta/FixA family protein [Thermotogota bacterium]
MKVLVFIKRTPDTAAVVKPTPDGKDIVRDGLAFIINPYDEFAVQEAVNLQKSKGAETVVMTVGDDASVEQLRRALAMGIDRAILVKHDRFWELNPSQVGYAIAEIARREKPDIILMGKVTIDDYTYALPGYVAQALGYNLLTYAVKLEYGDGSVKGERESDLGKETWEVPYPIVISAERGLNEPQIPTVMGIMKAKRKPLETVDLELPSYEYEIVELTPPPPRKGVKLLQSVDELIKVLKEEVKIL